MDERNVLRKFLFNQQDTAEFFGVTPQAVIKWNLKKNHREGKEVFYDLREAFEHWKKNSRGASKSKISLEEERAKLARVQTTKTKIESQLKKIELEEKKQSVIPAKEIEKVWGNLVGSFRAKILALPDRAAISVIAMKDEFEAKAFLMKIVNEALDELSRLNEKKE